MTRIIAGEFGGRVLRTPPSNATRPTSDRVREAWFSRLEHRGLLVGAQVLDLFSGSGALGLEALSRGAAHITFVEKSRAAAQVIKQNIRQLRVSEATHLVVSAAAPFLRATAASTAATASAPPAGSPSFDLVFIDPPYDLADAEVTLVFELLVPVLHASATIGFEFSSHRPLPPIPTSYQLVHQKRYGDTTLYFLEPELDAVTSNHE